MTPRRAGLYLDATVATLVVIDGETVSQFTSVITDPSEIARVVRELTGNTSEVETLTVVLGRPLVHLRTVRLAPMSSETAQRILARDWDRYVVAADRGARRVSAMPSSRGSWIAAFAPQQLVDDVRAACAASRVRITVTDAVLARAFGGQESAVVAVVAPAGRCIALVRDSLPHAGRTLGSGASPEDVARFAREQECMSAPVTVVGGRAMAADFAKRLGASHKARTSVVRDDLADSVASIIASLAAAAEPVLQFESEADVSRTEQASARVTWWIWAAAVAATLLGVVLERAAAHRQLERVSAKRAAIAAQVSAALAARDTVQARHDIVSALASREARASRSSGLMAAIALALPRGATLSSLQVSGDTLTLEGEAARGSDVYDALRKVPELQQLRLAAPLRQERNAAGEPVDHFAFGAQVRSAR